MKSLQILNIPEKSYSCSESINTLCTSLTFTGDHIKKIMITSCHAGEGKSFVSMNIALTLAKMGRNVVFVDADLRRSVIDARYKLDYEDKEHRTGLAHCLAGMASPDEVIYQTNVEGFYIVPVGHKVSSSLPLLTSPHFKGLLDDLAQSWDYVIVDAPPLGALIDAAEIARSCDGALLVVNYNAVHRAELVRIKEQLAQTGCPILGACLNQVAFDSYLSRKYYYYKSHYYDGYYYYYNNQGKEKRKKGSLTHREYDNTEA